MKNKGRLRLDPGGINFFVNRLTYFTFFADQSFCDPTSTTVRTVRRPEQHVSAIERGDGKGRGYRCQVRYRR